MYYEYFIILFNINFNVVMIFNNLSNDFIISIDNVFNFIWINMNYFNFRCECI